MLVFTLAVLPLQSAQVSTIENKTALECGEDCTCQEGALVLPILKGKGGQVRIASHPCANSWTYGDFSSPTLTPPCFHRF